MISRLLVLPLVWISSLIRSVFPILRLGSGTSLPGLIIEFYHPGLLKNLSQDLETIILISGTNGKTTTRALINHLLKNEGMGYITNTGGANIVRGIASSLLQNISFSGKTINKTAVFEVEEASLPIITRYMKADYLILTNVFRDQLDAYGEIDTTLEFFVTAINQSKPHIIINKDDKKLLTILKRTNTPQAITGFGMKERFEGIPEYEEVFEEDENIQFDYELIGYIRNKSPDGFELLVEHSNNNEVNRVWCNFSGSYQAYNVMAAVATASSLGINISPQSFKNFSPVFGRGEHLKNNSINCYLYLVKNPAGFDVVLKELESRFDLRNCYLCFALNDNIADGRDVSWIWDTHLEEFFITSTPKGIFFTGTRKYDMGLRIQYANGEVNFAESFIEGKDLPLIASKSKSPMIILATYTAMRDIRSEFAKIITLKNISSEGN